MTLHRWMKMLEDELCRLEMTEDEEGWLKMNEDKSNRIKNKGGKPEII